MHASGRKGSAIRLALERLALEGDAVIEMDRGLLRSRWWITTPLDLRIMQPALAVILLGSGFRKALDP